MLLTHYYRGMIQYKMGCEAAVNELGLINVPRACLSTQDWQMALAPGTGREEAKAKRCSACNQFSSQRQISSRKALRKRHSSSYSTLIYLESAWM